MRIAMVGTRGVPAHYGGFETAIEEIGRRLVENGHHVTVYCRGENRSPLYLGMRRVRLPALKSPTVETLSHTAISVAHLLAHRADVAIVFNAANSPFVPILRAAQIPAAVHVDGLEWKRAKWGPVGRRYYLAAERLAVWSANRLIADSVGIKDYYQQQYGTATELLSYGAPIIEAPNLPRLPELSVELHKYHLVVARLEPENHVDMIIKGYSATSARMPLIIVGSVPYASEHEAMVKDLAAADRRVRMTGGIWDQELLNALYAGCTSYLHGHHVGGTNPSLLRAMGAGASVIAFDVNFNREVLGSTGVFFRSAADIGLLIMGAENRIKDGHSSQPEAQARAKALYQWDTVASGYEKLCFSLCKASKGYRR